MGRPGQSRGLSPINRRVAERLRAKREELGLSQAALASRAETSAPHITQVEAGRRGLTLATLERLAKALHVPLVDLFADEPPLALEESPSRVLFTVVRKLRDRSDDELRAIERLIDAFDAAVQACVSPDES